MSAAVSWRRDLSCWAALPLRVIVGGGFQIHGSLKLGRGVEVFAAALAGLDLPWPELLAWITVVVEVLAGAAVLLGAFVTLMSVPMTVVLLVAMIKVHWQFGFSSIKFLAVTADGPQFGKPGIECDLLYLACIAALLLLPSDPASVDGWRAKRRSSAGLGDGRDRRGALPLGPAIAQVRDVRREEHGPVPFEEQPRLARERRHAQ